MATLVFDVGAFRAQFPGLFPDPPNTDALINVFWDAATCYVSPETEGPLSPDCRRQVLNLVTAHLITLSASAQAGNQPGFVVSASIDKISVSIQAPPSRNEFQFFLNQTPFGIQAYAMLYAAGAGGSYLGGFNELGSFRRAGGIFTPPSTGGSTPGVIICPALIVPPLAPYSIDYGTIGTSSNVTNSIAIVAQCGVFTASYDASTGGDVTLSVWTGLATDTHNRYNLYYWTGDDRAANSPPTATAKGLNPTGATIGDGFILPVVLSGDGSNNPNLIAITGVETADTQVLNLDVAIA